MTKRIAICCLFIFGARVFASSPVFHEKTYVQFIREPDGVRDYFGYSVLLTLDGLYVGAPKAISEVKWNQTAGVVYNCSLGSLDVKKVICQRFGFKDPNSSSHVNSDLMKSNSWFGSSLSLLAKDVLLITAPRLQSRYHYQTYPLQLQGASYLLTPKKNTILEPLADGGRNTYQSFRLDGKRPSYGPVNTSTYYYSIGQAGASVAVTKKNTILLGAPGLMQFTGGVISYSYQLNDTTIDTSLDPISNPYITLDLNADDYFGYSVESGIYERNGSVLYVGGAPRAELARGKVLVFIPPTDATRPLNIKAKLVGPKVGSYFGASLCSTDINNDGLDDLLVGAPTFVKNDYDSYDHGAVFVYLAKESSPGFVLEESGYVSGSERNGAWFGTTIADLGDINGDGYTDIAIGAPWEGNRIGAVYIYFGSKTGLNSKAVQRIQAEDARGFGWSISKGLDVDGNNCNDLAIGACSSNKAYLYRCIPTMPVRASIRVPNIVSLPHNVSTFTAMFCVSAPPNTFRSDLKLKLIGSIKADPNRSTVIGESQYALIATPGNEICDEKTIKVDLTSNLFQPIVLIFELQADELMKDGSTTFMFDAARVSDDTIMTTTLPVQIIRDCGDNPLCNPWLDMTLEALDNPYIPGTDKRFGIRLTVKNSDEAAYGLIVIISLPMNPKRIPGECLFEDLTMTCQVLHNTVWEIELEYNLNISENISLTVTAEFSDRFRRTTKNFNKVVIDVTPEAKFTISGKPMPNSAITVLRSNLADGLNISFTHSFEITNLGPSDWHTLTAHIRIPDKTYLSALIEGCERLQSGFVCGWTVPAKVSHPISIPLRIDLSSEGNFLKRNVIYNATSSVFILLRQTQFELKYMGYEVTTKIILEPAKIIWCVVTPCIFLGLFLLAIIVRILHKCGFFIRSKYDILLAVTEGRILQKPSPNSNVSTIQTSKEYDL